MKIIEDFVDQVRMYEIGAMRLPMLLYLFAAHIQKLEMRLAALEEPSDE